MTEAVGATRYPEAGLKPFVEAPAVEEEVRAALRNGDPESAIRLLVRGVWSIIRSPELAGRALYLRGLDQLVEEIGAGLADPALAGQPSPAEATVIVASEYYESGGHTRVAEDLCRSLTRRGRVVVVVTDTFSSYADGRLEMASVARRMVGAEVCGLGSPAVVGKVRQLQSLFGSVRPARVLFLNHHHDPVPMIAAVSLPAACQRVFLHHADYLPTLGCTLRGYTHVDVTTRTLGLCSGFLEGRHEHLPLYAADLGAKDFSLVASLPAAVVSSGPGAKYSFAGPLAYPVVIAAVLKQVAGNFFHIGPLSDAEQQQIRVTLRARGIDASRFVYTQSVPSLWASLRELPAHVYLGSFPISGGRTAIEVQGCGYPAIQCAAPDDAPLLSAPDLYAEPRLVWRTLDELRRRLSEVLGQHAAYCGRARRHYLDHHSREAFERALERIFTVAR